MPNDLISLKDKVTLITGGSRGIGRACAVMAAQAGSTVAVNYLNNSAAAEVTIEACETHGGQARAFQADITDLMQVEQMVQDVIDVYGRIDVLVNNAGIWVHNPIDEMTARRLKETIDTNLYGTFYPIMAVVPHMKRQRSGSIINISSTAGQRGEAYHSPYAATKGAVIALTKSLAPELADFSIRVNCVAPGWIDTDMSRPALDDDPDNSIVSKIPLGRVGTPEELAGPVIFLASDMATFITGEILNVNGGAVLCG